MTSISIPKTPGQNWLDTLKMIIQHELKLHIEFLLSEKEASENMENLKEKKTKK